MEMYKPLAHSRGHLSLAEENPELIPEWPQHVNGGLSPWYVSARSRRVSWWQCPNGHFYTAPVFLRTQRKTGCPYCSGRKAWPGESDLETLHPEIAALWHPTKNGSQTPDLVRPYSNKKYWWRGTCGHEWQRRVSGMQRSPACPVCHGRALCLDAAPESPAAEESHGE